MSRLAAYLDLFRRYKTVFDHFWHYRHEFDSKLFHEQEAEFLPAALSLQEKPVSPMARILAKILIILILSLLIWSVLGKVDIIVNANGKVIPNGFTKTIASIDIASVKALYVEEGQQVSAGDILIELDTSSSDAERDKAAGDESAALLQVARSKALIEAIDKAHPPRLPALKNIPQEKWLAERLHLEGEYRDFKAKLKRINDNITHFSSTLPLVTRRADDYKELLKDHDVAYHDWLEREQARADLAGQLADAKNQRNALIAETRRMAFDQLSEGSKSAAAAGQDAMRSDAHSKLLKLMAPVDGSVHRLDVHTIGGVVSAATPLMQIVPKNNQVEIQAFLENKDVGFVQVDQSVEVKIDAFDYTKYGTIPGKVIHVSRDAIDDDKKGLLYSVKIILEKNSINVESKDMPISAGMSVSAEIKTGDRRLIEYVLSPLIRHQHESLNER